MEHLQIRPIGEADIEKIILESGGRRAHPDADKRTKRGADFILEDIVIELKALDESGLGKPERQRKLAKLFREYEPERPVIVLDRQRLPLDGQVAYDRALEGPIKNAVASARKQLRQSRQEISGATRSVLFIVNNGYTALNHDELVALVGRRVRNDTNEIDGVIVGGCYFYSDTSDSFFIWPLSYVPIRVHVSLAGFDRLKAEWDRLAERSMTELLIGGHGAGAVKGPVVDTQFEVDEVTYVKPASSIGQRSEFFKHGRPRKNSSGLERCPPVGLTFPDMTTAEWVRFREALSNTPELFLTYEEWCTERREAAASGTALRPFVPVPVTVDGWAAWCADSKQPSSMASVRIYANTLFDTKVKRLLKAARQRTPKSILPECYILVVTEEIGQDKANDVSHIALVREQLNGETAIKRMVENLRIFHEHALLLACAYAVSEGINSVLWQKDQTYGWV